ncbi:MAG TPA: hypothetical protein VEB22_14215 [Phycisphaerales bacterium]|nr:hypothetical protein [Phycisphaerales bacterium]
MATPITSRPTLLAAALLLGMPAAIALAPLPAALAQEAAMQRVEPYVVVFTASEVPVRAGSSTIYYPIVFPKPGDALVVDGETTGWLRVMYPANVRAFIGADEAQESGAGKVRLTKPSKLKAPNANSGIKGAFLGVQENELPIGTEFKVADTIKDDAGKVIAYAVEPPSGARGWISREAVRRATDSEAAPVLAKLATAPAVTPVSPSGASPSAPTANTPADTTPAAQPEPQPTPPPIDLSRPQNPPVEPVAPPSPPAAEPSAPPTPPAPPPVAPAVIPTTETPGTRPAPAAPVATPPGMEIPGTVPVGDKDGGGSPVRSAPAIRADSVEALKELFNSVRAQPAGSAELEPAIAEFERFKRGLGSSSRDQALARQLDSYIEAMKMRKEVRDLANANAQINRETELMKSDVGKRVIELERQRVYNVIGRLVRSTVYDGGRAPVLYRVMSPEPGSARTLGYLLPDPNFDYAAKLEQVVGIIGEVRPDESLRTNLIVPKRVDVVSLAPIVVSPDIPGLVVPRGGQPAERPPSEMPRLPGSTPPAVSPPTRPPAVEPEKP